MTAEKIHQHNSDQTRIALLEQSIGTINQTLIRIENRLDGIDKEMKSNFLWTLGMMIGLSGAGLSMIIGLGAITAHGFHWF
jgi:hypothetical protein